MSENTMTKSQAKRKARLEESKKAKKEAKRTTFTTNLIIVLVVALFAAGIGSYVYYRMTTTQSSSDYSAYLNEDGTLSATNSFFTINLNCLCSLRCLNDTYVECI